MAKLVVFDVDGTLIDFAGQVSAATVEAIASLRSAGVVTAVATGRPVAALAETLDMIGPVDFAVCGNGSTVTDLASGELIRESAIAADAVTRIVKGVRADLAGVGVAVEHGSVCVEEPGLGRRLPPRRHVDVHADALVALGSPAPDAQRIIFFHDDYDDDLTGLAGIVETHIDSTEHRIFYGTTLKIVEVMPAGDDKSVALAALAARLGVDPADTIAIGDGTNDLGMLSWAGIGLAVGNARPPVFGVADRVIGSIDHDGVARFVAELLGSGTGAEDGDR